VEPVTHFLTNLCLSRAGLNRTTSLATAMMVASAEMPDLDLLYGLGGPAAGFDGHRGFTHTLLGAPLVGALSLAAVWLWYRLRLRLKHPPPTPPRWGLLFLYGCLGGVIHILLDFTNSYGVRPFAPFYDRWFAWDTVYIIEPVMLVILVAGLVLPSLFALIQEEVASRRTVSRGRGGAVIALAAIVVFWGVRDYQHRKAVAALEARIYQGEDPVRVSAFPYPINPFLWSAVAETKDFYASMHVNSLTGALDPEDRMEIRYKSEDTPVTLAAKDSHMGRVYMHWARHPMTEVEPLSPAEGGGYRVRFYDLRYVYPEPNSRRPLQASVELDRDLRAVAEQMSGRRKVLR
jgi:inner membrane protein